MKIIALTSANEAAMAQAAEQLLEAIADGQLQLSVSVGITDAHAASAVYSGGGELWRIGEDDQRPELDALVDRTIDDTTPARLAHDIGQALGRFVGKLQVAA